jgi:biopolymer transport protein ExbB
MLHNISKFFLDGGFFMVPLILLSIISVGFIIERGLALRRSHVIADNLYRAVFNLRMGQSFSEIASLAAPGRTCLARLIRVSIDHLPWSKAENVEALQVQARREINRLERGIVILEITIGIGPMLGLIGTVSGLITIFSTIGSMEGNQHVMIAKGISEALYTTVAGLVVAVPSLIAHSYYTKKIESMAVEMESICMDFLTKLYFESPKDES